MRLIITKNQFFFIFLLFAICFCNVISIAQIKPEKKQSSSVEDILKRNMFVKVTISKNKIFVGEPVLALYKFYTAVHGQAVVTKQPEFAGCSVTEINFNDDPQDEIINGQTYTAYTIRKVQLTPVQQGKLSIGIASVNNHIELPDPNDVFNSDNYDIEVSNAETFVDVEPLPEANKPKDFYGITGDFTITTTIENKKIPVGESAHLIITIKGLGNLDAINKPDISWPNSIEHFDGNDSQHIDQNSFPVSGDRVFDIPFVGDKEGNATIPAIHFSFFNPGNKNFETISTDSTIVTFTKALPKKEYPGIVNYDISNRKYLWIVGAIAFMVALISFISYKKNKSKIVATEDVTESTITPVPVFENVVHFKYKTDFSRHWNELENLSEIKPFFTRAKYLLMLAVSEFADSQHTAELFVLAEMKSKLMNEDLCKNVFKLVETCNEKMYAPFEVETDLKFYFDEIKNAIEKLQAES